MRIWGRLLLLAGMMAGMIAVPMVVAADQMIGGLDLGSYCNSHGYNGSTLQPNSAYGWACRVNDTQTTSIDLTKACQWQYNRSDTFAGTTNSSAPTAWKCYVHDPQQTQPAPSSASEPAGNIGGPNLRGYCQSQGYVDDNLPRNTADAWSCKVGNGQITSIDMNAACNWTFQRNDLTASYFDYNNAGSWRCYPQGASTSSGTTQPQIPPQTTTSPGGTSVQVNAQQGWQTTGMSFSAGTIVNIFVTGGSWSPWPGAPNSGLGNSSDVCTMSNCPVPVPSVPIGTLVGKIGSSVFTVGTRTTINAADSGTLYLRMNDLDTGLTDNAGTLTVQVSAPSGSGSVNPTNGTNSTNTTSGTNATSASYITVTGTAACLDGRISLPIIMPGTPQYFQCASVTLTTADGTPYTYTYNPETTNNTFTFQNIPRDVTATLTVSPGGSSNQYQSCNAGTTKLSPFLWFNNTYDLGPNFCGAHP